MVAVATAVYALSGVANAQTFGSFVGSFRNGFLGSTGSNMGSIQQDMTAKCESVLAQVEQRMADADTKIASADTRINDATTRLMAALDQLDAQGIDTSKIRAQVPDLEQQAADMKLQFTAKLSEFKSQMQTLDCSNPESWNFGGNGNVSEEFQIEELKKLANPEMWSWVSDTNWNWGGNN